MPTWLVWFLVAGNLLNMMFDGTIIAYRAYKWWMARPRPVESDPDYYPNPRDCG